MPSGIISWLNVILVELHPFKNDLYRVLLELLVS